MGQENLDDQSKEKLRKLENLLRTAAKNIREGRHGSREEKIVFEILQTADLEDSLGDEDARDFNEKFSILQALGKSMYEHYRTLAQGGNYQEIPKEIAIEEGKLVVIRNYFQRRYGTNQK